MSDIFYQPEGVWFGDCMPLFHDGTYYLFHQRDTRRPGPFGEPFGWALATTTDFVTYQDHGEVLLRGGDDDQDQFIFAGSVMRAGEEFLAFYTGFNRDYSAQGRAAQVLMVARSHDLLTWEKTGRTLVLPQEGYDPDDWRDPFVLWDEDSGQHVMILGARKAGPKSRTTGSTVWFTSTDLVDWQFRGDFWNPGLFTMHEMPDLFRMHGDWYLLTTEYSSESKTVYRVGSSLDGPWLKPADDAFDGRAYYAARSAGDDQRRFLFGWVATKEHQDDSQPWEWGGTLLVHEVLRRADGSLGVKPPDGVRLAFGSPESPIDGVVRLSSIDGLGVLDLGDVASEAYRAVIDFRVVQAPSSIGLRFAEDASSGESYCFRTSLDTARLTFDRRPSFPWPRYDNRGLERPVRLEPDRTHRAELLVDGSIACLYLDDVALSARVYDRAGTGLAIDVEGGEIEVLAVTVQQR